MSNIIPKHIAIICDGNRRWARAQGLAPFIGHQKAVNEVFEPLVDHAVELGVEYLTFWIFSTENWKREKKEVEGLMNLFRGFFDEQVARWDEKDVQVKIIGNRSMMPEDIQERIKKGEEKTKNNKKKKKRIMVSVAMSDGGRDEVLRACQGVVEEVLRLPEVSHAFRSTPTNSAGRQDDQAAFESLAALSRKVDKDIIERHLDTYGIPDPELIIRTSGEQRSSGYLIWQSEYAEWYFPTWHFPEFSPAKLDECVEEFNSRKRRFGK